MAHSSQFVIYNIIGELLSICVFLSQRQRLRHECERRKIAYHPFPLPKSHTIQPMVVLQRA